MLEQPQTVIAFLGSNAHNMKPSRSNRLCHYFYFFLLKLFGRPSILQRPKILKAPIFPRTSYFFEYSSILVEQGFLPVINIVVGTMSTDRQEIPQFQSLKIKRVDLGGGSKIAKDPVG